MAHKKPVTPVGMKRSPEYLYSALRVFGIPQNECYKLTHPENKANENTQKRNAQYFEAKEKTRFAASLVEKELQYRYGKVHYKNLNDIVVRDKETMIAEINDKLNAPDLLDHKQELDYRKLLSDLLHMKKEEAKEETKEKAPQIYLPDKHRLIKACKALNIPPEIFIAKLAQV